MDERDILLKTIETLNTTVSSLSDTNTSLQKRIDEQTGTGRLAEPSALWPQV